MQDIIGFMQQHETLTIALAIVLVLLLILELIKQKRGGNRLTPAAATRLINHENATIIDLRNTDAYAAGHILGAISLPIQELESKGKKIEKFKSNPIILVCATGSDSQRASITLMKKGFKVYVLGGGLRAWRDAEMPITKG